MQAAVGVSDRFLTDRSAGEQSRGNPSLAPEAALCVKVIYLEYGAKEPDATSK